MIYNISIAFILALICNSDQVEETCHSPEVSGFLPRKMLVINMPHAVPFEKIKLQLM